GAAELLRAHAAPAGSAARAARLAAAEAPWRAADAINRGLQVVIEPLRREAHALAAAAGPAEPARRVSVQG
ncbi:MAG: hypothetical protein AAF772_13650, partial [Acidobacteriota bacterium]